jgi:hypothetical protein
VLFTNGGNSGGGGGGGGGGGSSSSSSKAIVALTSSIHSPNTYIFRLNNPKNLHSSIKHLEVPNNVYIQLRNQQ